MTTMNDLDAAKDAYIDAVAERNATRLATINAFGAGVPDRRILNAADTAAAKAQAAKEHYLETKRIYAERRKAIPTE